MGAKVCFWMSNQVTSGATVIPHLLLHKPAMLRSWTRTELVKPHDTTDRMADDNFSLLYKPSREKKARSSSLTGWECCVAVALCSCWNLLPEIPPKRLSTNRSTLQPWMTTALAARNQHSSATCLVLRSVKRCPGKLANSCGPTRWGLLHGGASLLHDPAFWLCKFLGQILPISHFWWF